MLYGTEKKKVANMRNTFCLLAIAKMGYPGAEVACGVAHLFS
jgi:hypothetical protein